LLDLTVRKYTDRAPKLAAWLEENVPEGLTVFEFPGRAEPPTAGDL
jgi:putative transposase